MNEHQITDWLLQGDISIQYQTYRYILNQEREDLRHRIATEGWGALFLSAQRADGHWGLKFYQPKWTSTHYTLQDLRNLEIAPYHPVIKKTIEMIATHEKGPDGGINPSGTIQNSDVCINGMFLNYAAYFRTPQEMLKSVVNFILSQVMPDGGFNCRFNRSGAFHSSLHSTVSVYEGITEYLQNGYVYRAAELKNAAESSREFMLRHQFFISDRTGEIISKDFLRLNYPFRWRYNILRALDALRHAGSPFDPRMAPALSVLLEKRNSDHTWNLPAKLAGQVHFDMEKAGKPSRWNTLRALRVLNMYGNMLRPEQETSTSMRQRTRAI